MIFLRSFIFYIGYLGSGLLASFLACVFGPFLSLNSRLKFFSLWPKFANWLLYVTCNIKLTVVGEEHIPNQPCVIVSNHQGQWETFSMQYLFSIGTTTGYLTSNYANWPLFLPIMLLTAAFIGACAGSTGGGIKVIRALVLMRQGAKRQDITLASSSFVTRNRVKRFKCCHFRSWGLC